ncbi:MAG: serine/threonine-protein kinase [Cyanobacteria bacterium J06650_10]
MSYKIGDTIGKYTVTRDFDSANGGQCQWGFGKYGGQEYFIKKFLSPVYPGSEAPGSEKGKQKRRNQCEKFEKKQSAIINALSDCGNGGLVVSTVECFKHGDEKGKHYFKVSQKVDTSSLSEKVHTLDAKDRLFVMLTAAGAVKILHKAGIIHLDLKPDNILIQEYKSKLIAKVIDFDSSILEGESTEAETLVGDAVYYSPEFAKHIETKGETAVPTKKSDIFSLGLIFCRYWTGSLPHFPDRYNYAHEAVLSGGRLTPNIHTKVSEGEVVDLSKKTRLSGTLMKSPLVKAACENSVEMGIQKLIQQMLSPDVKVRPSISEVHENLKSLYHHGRLLTSKKSSKKDTSRPKTKLTISKSLKS